MQEKLEWSIKYVLQNFPPGTEKYTEDQDSYQYSSAWVYVGQSGRALSFFKLYLNQRTLNPAKAQYYLSLAKQYIDSALAKIIHDKEDQVGFLQGNVGVYAVASVIYEATND